MPSISPPVHSLPLSLSLKSSTLPFHFPLKTSNRFFVSGQNQAFKSRQHKASGVRTINGAYIKDIANGGELYFQGMPTEISDSKSANWSSTSILGRSEPIQGYADSGPRVISFQLEFAQSVDQGDQSNIHGSAANTPGGNTEIEPTTYVLSSVAWLQSLVYPDYSGFLVKPPPTCLLLIGGWIRMRCICKDVQATWKGPWEPDSLTPLLASVSLTFEELNEKQYEGGPWGYKEVRDSTNFSAEAVTNNFVSLV